MRVLLAVHLPRLQLEVFRPKWLPEPAHGCAVLEQDRVLVASRTARAAGIRPGMKRGGVLTLAPGVEMFERDVARELDAQRAVAVTLMQFSPEVALVEEATVIVDISASLRLFGGVLNLCRAAKALLTTLGFSARVSLAPTGQGAWLLAKRGNRRLLKMRSLERHLATVPLWSVIEVRPFVDWFAGLGCETIADVRRLPRAGLQRRCGEHLLDSLDRAFGTAPELFDWLDLPPTFSARIELPDRLEHTEGALFAAHRLVVQLCGWLCAKQLAVTGVQLLLEHERGRLAIAPTVIEIALGEPAWREDHLLRLLRERLARLTLEAPVIALRLDAAQVQAAEPPSGTLFQEPGGSAEDHARLVELLAARLGNENVLRPMPGADHRPEVANRWVPLGQSGQAGQPMPLPAGLPRPTWLLETPVQLLMRNNRPFYGSPLKMASTGERIEAGWFDEQLVKRDYFVAQADDQSCYWIYRELISSRDENDPHWFLHGLFG
ncbi:MULTISPECIES: DNA polymerase Y family protein [Paraburkholderia]|uniref:Y-family DNA polymerase n=1 Tax=Paraburkholderia TaxID=1822464 RepID=UPI002251397D|nr:MULTISPECIES: DNA polymerase Y family protein [Paraburkholderia]MCX4161566.1 DNA polymerase Y family protein [Paraburkholderia megapolitana]MDN7157062.1 DNA polymerase Y family protein [Paraburkholderia sp. CHISQ3]MDQ6494107.1 DNA polymerase Y family protein [Paraburkholderia megapolitana]